MALPQDSPVLIFPVCSPNIGSRCYCVIRALASCRLRLPEEEYGLQQLPRARQIEGDGQGPGPAMANQKHLAVGKASPMLTLLFQCHLLATVCASYPHRLMGHFVQRIASGIQADWSLSKKLWACLGQESPACGAYRCSPKLFVRRAFVFYLIKAGVRTWVEKLFGLDMSKLK